MKIQVIRNQELGRAPKTSVFIDGEECDSAIEFSREVTDTSYEVRYGIFSIRDEFQRGNAKVGVDFGSDFSKWEEAEDLESWVEELKRRVNLVKKAFEEKYPEQTTQIEFEI